MNKALPVLGICAASKNSGKTTLITQLITALAKHNLRVSVIKHAHHLFDIDHPGKDSYKIREAGAVQTLIASEKRWALMTEIPHSSDTENKVVLEDLLKKISTESADLILVEGFKQAKIPKIEVYRSSLESPLLANSDADIIAIASDAIIDTNIPVLDINNIAQIIDFILKQFNFKQP